MADRGTQKTFETAGIFWLPEKRELQVHGQLKYISSKGTEVVLTGEFAGPFNRIFPIVHGILDDGPCTLFNCSYISSKGRLEGLGQTVLDARLMLAGAHIWSIDENIFNGLKVRFDNLDEWAFFRSVTIDREDWQRIGGPSKFNLHIPPPITANFKNPEGTLTLIRESSGHFTHREIDWEIHSFLELQVTKLINIGEVLEHGAELQRLVGFLCGHRSTFSFFSAQVKMEQERKQLGVYGEWPTNYEQKKSFPHFLTYLVDIADIFPSIAASWYESPDAIKMARRFFANVVLSEGQYFQSNFLSLMQCVEATHSALDARKYMSDENYEIIRRTLVDAIPENVEPSHRQSLENRIRYGNSFSLRKCFMELFRRLPTGLSLHICKNPADFVAKTVDFRNVLTHPRTDGTSLTPDWQDMLDCTKRIELLLTALFLNKLGMSFEKIEQLAVDGPGWMID